MLRPAFLALLLTSAAAPTFAQTPAETVPLLREIKQWVVGCDNLRNCHALSAPSGVDEEDYSSLTLHLWHQAGPEGYLRLRFDHRGQDVDLSTLLLDGKPLGLELTRDLHVELDDQGGDPEVQSYGVIEDAAARRWLQRLRNGQRLQLPGDEQAHVSLSGLSASLLLMDAVQGRVDNVTALARTGKGAASDVPPRMSTPVLRKFVAPPALTTQEQASLMAAALQAVRPEEGEPEATAGALTAQQAITVVRYDCAAYNCEYDVNSRKRQAPYDETSLAIQPLPLDGAALQGSVWYDEATGTLSYFYKLRGIGDCGGTGSWVFDGERLRLSEFRMMPRCTGVASGDWPALWSTHTAP
ncbi:DUF1176 domain-containing protein [Pseudomonas pergaminensis]|jgi:hypothetical protein|uniref:DUF1176 domain-containing protein n=1 Tax=Pseudomonas TaxID=286 RepID=UPI000C154897|nr:MULTISPECIES: DUF1176 domain-containing protein [unclassified Pseudomonas]PIB50372.1 hypothetical protein AOA57_08045 [Pseudomonas sp. 2588-5]MBT1260354.1 DUF1176 domain-containing protein [Pseudomonas sp. VS40]MBT1271804.1 DUF1176 domain-containing protein [Pseudomonas sp. VS59]PJK32859.1 DUF1176 domain-containing protein [Pseudomonas sp. S09F 262]PJK42349.1 DUF1176 domain-containing protein [Pseudomonas sp. S10E 269]